MSDDLGQKVQQIAQLLGQDSVPDNVKELVALFADSLAKKDDSNAQTILPELETSENTLVEEPVINADLLNTARKSMDRVNSASDPRINLLQAIKPFMNNKRQRKIGNCIQLLQISGLSRLLNEHEK